MSNKRNSYLISKAMKHFIFASVLTMAVQQLNITLDGIIVSRLLSPDAFSAVNLYQPVMLVIVSLFSFLASGAATLASRALGERDNEKVNTIFSTAMVSVVVAGLVITCVGTLFKQEVTDLICKDIALKQYFQDYLGVMVSFCVVTMVSQFANTVVSTDGKPKLVTRSVAFTTLLNVLLDLVFVGWLEMGISGSAYATIIAMVINALTLSRHIFSEKCKIRINPTKYFSSKVLAQNMKNGVPFILTNTVLMLLLFGINLLMQSIQGKDGLFAISICLNILMLGMVFANGISALLLSVGCFLIGKHDVKGVHFLVNVIAKAFLGVMIVIVLFVEICPDVVTRLFVADASGLLSYTSNCLRIFVPFLPCMLGTLVLSSVYQMNGLLSLPPIISLLFPVSLVPSLYLWITLGGSDSVWYAFPTSGIIMAAGTVLCSMLVYIRNKERMLPVTLLPAHSEKMNVLDISVKNTMESLVDSLKHVDEYLEQMAISDDVRNNTMHCVEEICLNIVQYGAKSNRDNFFDVNIVTTDASVRVSIMDDGVPFNPTCFYTSEGCGLKIVHAYCSDLDYKYMYGLNMTFLNWKFNK